MSVLVRNSVPCSVQDRLWLNDGSAKNCEQSLTAPEKYRSICYRFPFDDEERVRGVVFFTDGANPELPSQLQAVGNFLLEPLGSDLKKSKGKMRQLVAHRICGCSYMNSGKVFGRRNGGRFG